MGAEIKDYDFCGWATKYNLECEDGRTIAQHAFDDMDGADVSIVYNHDHKGISSVLGHAVLEARPEGIFAYGYLNDTAEGEHAKKCLAHGDIKALSIYANNLKHQASRVVHGVIRELSLVLAGANPGALIDEVVLAHGDDLEDGMVIPMNESEIALYHSAEKADKKEEKDSSDLNVGEVFEGMTEDQQAAAYVVASEIAKEMAKEMVKSEGGKEDMQHNAFDIIGTEDSETEALQHSAIEKAILDGKKNGTMKESFLAHSEELAQYGIGHIDYLAPEFQVVNGPFPNFIKRQPDDWVNIVMNGVHHTPFAKIKTLFADLTEDEARAKGYIKGNFKTEEYFDLSKREVGPTTVYKKQKMDKDDIKDITDLDVISWLKSEMRMMLDEELARAFLFGDGRSNGSADKIKADCIIPAIADAPLFTIQKTVTPAAGQSLADALIDACVEAQDEYEGSGNLYFFTSRPQITKMRLLKDNDGHRLYKDINELALACGVAKIVAVPASIIPSGKIGVMLDLNDYNVGADKGGSVDMFEDFDIDFNQMKYLIETRCSGALIKAKSAICLIDGSQSVG